MSTESLLYIYAGNVLFLWLILGLSTLFLFSRERLRSKGYAEPYIQSLQTENRTRCLGIAVVIPLMELVAAAVVFWIFGSISTYQHFVYICLLTIIGLIPFPILDSIQTTRKHKALARSTRQAIIVDLKYRVWHLVFNPVWEAVSALAVAAYFVWSGRYFDLALLHIVILWLLYLAVRSSRFLTGPAISDLYQYNFCFMVINHLLVIYHLIRFVTACCLSPGQLDQVLGMLLIAAWIAKLVVYLLRMPQFRREITFLIRADGES